MTPPQASRLARGTTSTAARPASGRPRRRLRSGVLVGALLFFFAPALAFAGGMRAQPIENRPLAGFPSASAGWGFFAGFDRWAVDHLPLRDLAVQANTAASERVFAQAPDYGSRPADVGPVGPAPVAPVPVAAVGPARVPAAGTAPGAARGPGAAREAEQAGKSGAADAAGASDAAGAGAGTPEDEDPPTASRRSGLRYPYVIEGRDGWLYSGKDMRFACEPELQLDEIFTGYRRLISILEASGRRVLLAVAPDKSTVLPENLPGNYLGKKCTTEKKAELWDRLNRGDLSPQYVDLREPLEQRQAADGQPIYFKNDSHWTSLGRVIFAREVLNRLDPTLYRDTDVVDTGVKSRSGDLARQLGTHREDALTFWELHPPGATSRMDGMDESRWRVTHYRGTGGPGRPLFAAPTVLMGDSFSVESIKAFRPYFADLTFANRELWPQTRIPILQNARTIVIEVVERVFISDSTSSQASSLVDKDFLDELERRLTPVPGTATR